jgi:hypothetical protein
MDGPTIRPLPTAEGFKRNVDLVLGADPDDAQVRALVDLVLTPANAEDDRSWALANAAARHAFSKSEAFEEAFRKFADMPDGFALTAQRFVVEAAEREM